MNFKYICSSLFITLVVTLAISLILDLLGITTISLISPTIVGLILFEIGLINLVISFVALIHRNCSCKCYIKSFTNKLILLFLFSISLIIYVLVGFILFLNTAISLLVFSIGLFLFLGVLFTEISIITPLFSRNRII